MDELGAESFRRAARIADEAMNEPIVPPISGHPSATLQHYRNLIKRDFRVAFTAWIDSYTSRSTDDGMAFTEISQAISEVALDHQTIPPQVFISGDAAEFCQAVICEDESWFYNQPPNLVYSILTIIDAINMSAAFIARETGDRAITMHSELANLVVALTQSAWAHHAIFLDNGCSDNVCIGWARALRMRMLTLLPLMYNMVIKGESDAREDYSRLILLCWYHSPDLANADLLFSFAFRHFPGGEDPLTSAGPLLDDNDRGVSQDVSIYDPFKTAWDFTQRHIIDVYGLENFLRRVSITAKQPLLRDHFLFLFLRHIEKWLLHPKVWPQAAATGLLAGLRDAAERQALHGEDKYQWGTTSSSMLIAQFISDLAPAATGAAYVVRDCALVEILARAVRLAAHLRRTSPEATSFEQRWAYDACLKSLKTFSGVASAVNMRAGRNNLRKILRQSMRREWYPTLVYIRDSQPLVPREGRHKHLSLVAAWKAFGEIVGMEEEQAKKDHDQKVKKDARVCSWAECQYHDSQPPSPLMACKGCAEVLYCSRSCQRHDWYEGKHKLRCRRLKNT